MCVTVYAVHATVCMVCACGVSGVCVRASQSVCVCVCVCAEGEQEGSVMLPEMESLCP